MEHIINLLETYGYLILFPLAAIEGPIIALVVGFLIYLGYLAFIPSFAILLLGDLIPDVIYYYLGRFGNKKNFLEKYKEKLKIISSNFHIVERLWRDHGRKTMFFSKLAYGLSTPFLISAGLVNMPLRRFVSYAFPVTIFQYAAILTIGYFLGNSYQIATQYIKDAGIIITVLVIILVAAYIFMARYAKDQITKLEVEEKKIEEHETKKIA
jgi:membrane protein DedA with SNARE-associated domain